MSSHLETGKILTLKVFIFITLNYANGDNKTTRAKAMPKTAINKNIKNL